MTTHLSMDERSGKPLLNIWCAVWTTQCIHGKKEWWESFTWWTRTNIHPEQNQSLRTFWTKRLYALDNRQEVVSQILKLAKDARAAKVLQLIDDIKRTLNWLPKPFHCSGFKSDNITLLLRDCWEVRQLPLLLNGPKFHIQCSCPDDACTGTEGWKVILCLVERRTQEATWCNYCGKNLISLFNIILTILFLRFKNAPQKFKSLSKDTLNFLG